MNATPIPHTLQRFFLENRRMPTVREFKDVILHSTSMKQTQKIISTLIDEGLLERDARGKLLPTTLFTSVKKLGVIEAGFPSPAEEELLDTMTLDEWLIHRREATYMLEVKGESMIDAGIHPGDTALVERGRQPKNNDIVIACIDGKWTMKTYRKQSDGRIALIPANKKFPVMYAQEELRVEAIVTAIIRKY